MSNQVTFTQDQLIYIQEYIDHDLLYDAVRYIVKIIRQSRNDFLVNIIAHSICERLSIIDDLPASNLATLMNKTAFHELCQLGDEVVSNWGEVWKML